MSDNFGFVRVAGVSPVVKIADTDFNTTQIISYLHDMEEMNVDIALFPELSVTGYTCADLFFQNTLLENAKRSIAKICKATESKNTILIVGAPVEANDALYNCAVVISNGDIIGIVPKSYLPNYNEFYEKRWFKAGDSDIPPTIKLDITGNSDISQKEIPFGTNLIFKTCGGVKFGIEICEDLWVPIPPSSYLAINGAEMIFNLSASNEGIGKHQYLKNLITTQSGAGRCAYVYASAGVGESSTDLVFSGNVIIAENGRLLGETPRFTRDSKTLIRDIDIAALRNDRLKYNSFSDLKKENNIRYVECGHSSDGKNRKKDDHQKLLRDISPLPFVPSSKEHLKQNCEEIISMQCWGLEQRLLATNCKKLIIGISGGLDSTLALLVACRAFSRLMLPLTGIIGITMPGEATTSRTRGNAWALMKELGVTALEIPIGKAVDQHFKDIDQDPTCFDAAYENSQARERTQILMDMANKHEGMVLGTGDLSELALGWCTYNGDHMSMYGVNASVPKTLVKHLVEYFANTTNNRKEREILQDIINTPISPELIPSKQDEIAQRTEDIVGPYELHDFFLYHVLRYSRPPGTIFFLATQAFEGKYDKATIIHWMENFYRRFFNQQFKRSCMPDGPKIGSVCLSPRGDWRMPSDATYAIWLKEVKSISLA